MNHYFFLLLGTSSSPVLHWTPVLDWTPLLIWTFMPLYQCNFLWLPFLVAHFSCPYLVAPFGYPYLVPLLYVPFLSNLFPSWDILKSNTVLDFITEMESSTLLNFSALPDSSALLDYSGALLGSSFVLDVLQYCLTLL